MNRPYLLRQREEGGAGSFPVRGKGSLFSRIGMEAANSFPRVRGKVGMGARAAGAREPARRTEREQIRRLVTNDDHPREWEKNPLSYRGQPARAVQRTRTVTHPFSRRR